MRPAPPRSPTSVAPSTRSTSTNLILPLNWLGCCWAASSYSTFKLSSSQYSIFIIPFGLNFISYALYCAPSCFDALRHASAWLRRPQGRSCVFRESSVVTLVDGYACAGAHSVTDTYRRPSRLQPSRGSVGAACPRQHSIPIVAVTPWLNESDKPVSLFKVTWVACDG